jgi:hypothetical protein
MKGIRMIPVDFNQVVEEQIAKCQGMLVSKREEYVMGTNDVLHNFKQAANLQNCEVRQALGGMMVKHTVSVFDMIEAERTYDMATWAEKITDSINYLLLLRAVLVDEAENGDVIAERRKVLEEIELVDEDEIDDQPEHVEYPDTPNV